MRITGTYVSPNFSAAAIINFLTIVIKSGTGKDCIIGDLNAREYQRDRARNTKESEIKRRLTGKK